MKKIFFLLLLFPFTSYSQHMSCCNSSATEKMAQLASDDQFASAHDAPLPFHYEGSKGAMIAYKCPDKKMANAFEIKSDNSSNVWILVFHEWWGLNDYIKKEAESLNKDLGVNVLALDLYDGQLAQKPEEAQKIMGAMKDERCRNIISGAVEYIGSDSRIITLGWCMGGGWSLQASIMGGKSSMACVMYYGMPETDLSKLKSMNADVLGIFGTKDEWITPAIVETFQNNMKKAGKNLLVKNYDAPHAFANPSNPNYNQEATSDAHEAVIEFLKQRLN
jgi:carboxymethylenebutenolidase